MVSMAAFPKRPYRRCWQEYTLPWQVIPLRDEAKYTDARDYAKKVILSDVHALNPSFSQIFINLTQDKYDIKECLWEVEYYGNNQEIIREGGYVGSWMGVVLPQYRYRLCL